MPLPTLVKKEEMKGLTPTNAAKKLFQAIYREQNQDEESDEIPKIRVSSLISKMAFYYEKIRNSVDYKEEHLLRKNAILRILKRHILFEGAIQEVKSEEISKLLLMELIRAGYLPNNQIDERKIVEIGRAIQKYIILKKFALDKIKNDYQAGQSEPKESHSEIKNQITAWIMALMACDIEERLGRSSVTQTVIGYMYDILNGLVALPDGSLYQKDKEIQIFISIHRNLLKYDKDMASFMVFKYYNADWQNENKLDDIEAIGKNILTVKKAIDDQIIHPLAAKMNVVVKRYALYFSILTEVVSDNPIEVYEEFTNDPKAFPRQIKNICNARYRKVKSKLWRAAVRSIIYIFLTKSVFAVLLEIPADKIFGEAINPFALTVNIAFPAALLFAFVLFTRMPSDSNTDKIATGIQEIVFKEKERKEPIILREPAKRGNVLSIVFGIVYGFTFMFSIYMVVRALVGIGFNWVSIIIFLFFLAFVSFFSFRIRKGVKEITIVEARESFFGFITDFFYTPIVVMGKWLSEKFSRINVFVFFLDFIIEAPFKVFVNIAEEWTKYVKERKEEIV